MAGPRTRRLTGRTGDLRPDNRRTHSRPGDRTDAKHLDSGSGRGENDVTQASCRCPHGGSRSALGRARGVRRIGRPPGGTDASEVTRWNQVAATTLAAVPGPNGGAPPAFQINMGMVQGAVYDAVNAIGPKRHRPYLLNRRTGARASIDAAVATAAYDVLSELVSTAPDRAPFPGRVGLLSTLSSAYAASLGSIDNDSFKKQGISVGHASA